MSYLLTQIFLYMLCAFILGLILGWLIWRYGKPSAAEYEALRIERDALLKERDALLKERVDLNTNLDACRARSAKAREENVVVETPAPVAAVAPVVTKEASKPKGLSGPRGGKADDLQEISGVGPKMEKLLYDLGYYHFDQIAAWSKSEVSWVDDNLEGFKGRVTRDDWQSQARKLAKR